MLADLAQSDKPAAVLQAYLLGTVDFEAALAWQRRMVYEVSCDRNQAYLLVCEHPPLVTIGRHGSRRHLRWEPDELRVRRWPVRWVNRGGGCLLHVPGQLAIYPVLALDRWQLGLQAYLNRLQAVLLGLLADHVIKGESRPATADVWVGDRALARLGVAVRDWVAYHGAFLNVNPDLTPFRRILAEGAVAAGVTSLERERRGPVRMAHVRERLLEHFVAQFGFARLSLFSDHPVLSRETPSHAVITRY